MDTKREILREAIINFKNTHPTFTGLEKEFLQLLVATEGICWQDEKCRTCRLHQTIYGKCREMSADMIISDSCNAYKIAKFAEQYLKLKKIKEILK